MCRLQDNIGDSAISFHLVLEARSLLLFLLAQDDSLSLLPSSAGMLLHNAPLSLMGFICRAISQALVTALPNLNVDFFPGLVIYSVNFSLLMLGASIKLEFPVSHAITRMNVIL